MSTEAGNRGPDVRSDCWIGLTSEAEAGFEIESRVEALYGESLTGLVSNGIEQLGLVEYHVRVEDQGALPWVIMARLEAAARAAVRNRPEPYLPDRIRPRTEPRPDRMRRSRLYLPGNTPKFMLNAGRHGPDGVILDLEDSVAPARKPEARLLVRNALRCIDFRGAEVMVRVNQLPLGLEDLDEIVPEGPEMILIPKVESPDQVREVEGRCRTLAGQAGIHVPLLMPILESAKGILLALEIASASSLVAALTIGLEDYTADLGVERTTGGRESIWARSRLVNAARAAGLPAIDTVFSDVADEEGLRNSVLEARGLGFAGKGCIHPRQIPVIHQAFAPTAAEVERATAIVRVFEAAEARGDGVVALGSKMIDAPVVERALGTVRTAVELGLLDPEWHSAETPE